MRSAVSDSASEMRHPVYERGAEGPDFPHLGFIGRPQESVPFCGRQVFAVTMLVVQGVHAAI
jgi:hypothetical protein